MSGVDMVHHIGQIVVTARRPFRLWRLMVALVAAGWWVAVGRILIQKYSHFHFPTLTGMMRKCKI
jgi:hypothetical protein